MYFIVQATTPSDIWLRDLNVLGDVLDDIAEITRKQEIEDAKQRKNAAKRKVRRLNAWYELGYCLIILIL